MPLLRTVLLSAGALVVGGGALLGVATAAAGDEVPRGVRVMGVDLGGTPAAAVQDRVREAVAPLLAQDVRVRADDQQVALDPEASGLSVDVPAVADDALGGGPVERLRGLLGAGRDVEVLPAVDPQRLRAALAPLQKAVAREAREGAVRFDGTTPVGVPPVTGRALDLDGAVEVVGDGWMDGEQPLEAPVALTEVKTEPADVERALDEVAKPAVAAPVVVTVGEQRLEVRPADVAKALRFTATDDGLDSALDPKALVESLGDRLGAVEQEPRDARITIRGGGPQVVPARNGQRVDPAALVGALQPVLARPAPRTATVPLVVAEPELTTAEAEQLGVREVIGTFTTEFPCCRPRVTNIRRIAEIVDGELVLPGETYSLNGDVGRRTRAKGFVPAPQILDGEFVDDVGGGVSQFATTMWNAVFFSGLEEVEHKPHSYYITRYPEGREATVFFPDVDLKWRNDSEHGVLVTTSSGPTSVTVTLWGTKRYDVRAVKGPRTRIRPFEKRYVQRDDCTAAAGHVGFDVTVTRVFEQGGREVKRERFSTRYLPEPNFICGPPPGGGTTR